MDEPLVVLDGDRRSIPKRGELASECVHAGVNLGQMDVAKVSDADNLPV